MAATHVVSLFLPNTIEWVDAPAEEKRPPTPPVRSLAETRNVSAVELPRRAASQVSLATTQSLLDFLPQRASTASTAVVAAAQAESAAAGTGTGIADVFGSEHGHRDPYKLHFATPGDPRSTVRSDAEVAEWGRGLRFNQPRSRAGPLPSGSILDFAKVFEELARQPRRETASKHDSATSSQVRSPRAGSEDREYEGKSWVVQPALQGNGGLTNAMRSVDGEGETDIYWVGTLGFPTDALPAATKADLADHLGSEYQSDVVYVRDKDMDGHYVHFCKTILWPIFHYQVPDHPKSKAYADHSWSFYRNVNQAFADKVVDSYKRGDTIWIHDYHLLLVPAMVRNRLPDAQIGFFLHVPFPSSEIFRCLSTRKQLLEGMLGANLIAFQIQEYAEHFLQTCSRLLAVETTQNGVQLENHFVDVTSQPMGINPGAIRGIRESSAVAAWIDKFKTRFAGKKLIVGRDKFDSIYGIRQKLLAYELFLKQNPEWSDKVVMIQVATSASPQSELLTSVSDICSRIDKNHHNLEKQSLVFLKQDIEFNSYLALLTVADVLMVSALRDGMNLTPHEYIVCQKDKHGPLILSEFTGSANLLQGGHLSINPWDCRGQANAIKEALEMDDVEKKRRWSLLAHIVKHQTGGRWAEELGKNLKDVYETQSRRASTSIPRLSLPQVSEKYQKAQGRRLFLIDYEGTLSPHRTSTGIMLSSMYHMVAILNDLMSDPQNIVYIMSARKPIEIEADFRTATGLGLIAENGCYIRDYEAPPREWHTSVDLLEMVNWKKEVKPILNYYRDRMEGSIVEERICSTIFHYDKVDDQEAALRLAGDCAEQINSSCKMMRIQAVPIKKAILIEQTVYSKATAATHIFDKLSEEAEDDASKTPDFLLVIGDDREDEVVYHWANELERRAIVPNVFTVSVGKRNTEAQATLTQGSSGLLTLLQKLTKLSPPSASGGTTAEPEPEHSMI